MIYYLVTRQGRDMAYMYLASSGRDYVGRFRPVLYDAALKQHEHPPGVYIFSDLERLSASTRQAAGRLWQRLHERAPEYQLLNHPTQSLCRHDLLARLADEGVNQHRAYRITETVTPKRFPVFLRGEDDHDGTQSPRLTDQAELDAELAKLRRRGVDLTGWLIVEFHDTADADGLYRCYSSFIVGQEVIPHHLMFSRGWVIKSQKVWDDAHHEEEMQYMRTNPHRDELLRIFQMAQIELGRIDYALDGDRLEVWEINTNSAIMTPGALREGARVAVHEHFNAAFNRAVDGLLNGAAPASSDQGMGAFERIHTHGHIAYERFRATGIGSRLRRLRRRLRGEPG